MQNIFFSVFVSLILGSVLIHGRGGGGGVQTMITFCVPVQFMLQFFIKLTVHQECFYFLFYVCLFFMCVCCFFCFMFVCFMFVCLFCFFFVCIVFFSILAHFLSFGCMFVKARSKTQEKSFNYIYNGIKINILICLGISVFFPSICFFLADLQ